MKPRLVDVATLAGVSMKTVSNVVNGAVNVREPTKQRVLQAIEQLGYRPNIAARHLAGGRSGVIALAIPGLDRPYFASLAAALLDEAAAVGWTVIIHQTAGDHAAELAVLTEPHAIRLDGIVLSPRQLNAADVAQRDPSIPVVLLGEDVTDDFATDHVGIDNFAAAKAATQHLLDAGCRRIVALTPTATRRTDRRAGYQAALAAAGIEPDDAWVIPTNSMQGQGAEAALGAWLDAGHEPPQGVFAETDWMAMGAMRALQLRGHDVPADVAVIGFDDIPYDLAMLPLLSTVSPDRTAIARLALGLLRQQPKQREPARLQAPFTLVGRESSQWRAARPTVDSTSVRDDGPE